MKVIKGLSIAIVVEVIFLIGMVAGKLYAINFQEIHSTDSGYSIELDHHVWTKEAEESHD